MLEDIGKKVRVIRTGKKLTLKDMSEKTGMSTGYLSQFENGQTAIALDTLAKIASVLETDISEFVAKPKLKSGVVVRSYQRDLLTIENEHIITHNISNITGISDLVPKVVNILPSEEAEIVDVYAHKGEEFIYMLDGVLTLTLGEDEYQLFPGDSAQYPSAIPHNWCNRSNKVATFLTVNTPNFVKSGQ